MLIDRGKERGPAKMTKELQRRKKNQESVTKDEGEDSFRKRTSQQVN